MKLKITQYGAVDPYDSIALYAEQKLSGQDYERGQIETIEAATDNVTGAFGRLLDVFADRGLLTPENVQMIVEGNNYNSIEFKK